MASTGDTVDSIEMRYEDENIWLTQKMMAELYGVSVSAINQHLRTIYDDGELSEEATIKKYLIVQNDVLLEWHGFVAEEKEKELASIISDEKLKDAETRKFMQNAFRYGEIKTTGTDIDKLMPAMSRFGGGNRAEKKETIIEKLKAFFEKYFGLVSEEETEAEQAFVKEVPHVVTYGVPDFETAEGLKAAQDAVTPNVGCSFSIHKNSITNLSTDAIVNAANSDLVQGGGVCGVIFKAAGSAKLAKECAKIGHCDTGDAVITSACDMPNNKFIIHAVGPRYIDGKHGEEALLSGAYKKALELARDNDCKSVGFPLISAGIFGYPLDDAWRVAIKT